MTRLIASLRLMSYQSTDSVSPRTQRGLSTTPAVHVRARSALRSALPEVVPKMLLPV